MNDRYNYILIIGDRVGAFYDDCLKPISDFVRLISIDEMMQYHTDGLCMTLDDFVKNNHQVTVEVLNSYTDEEEFRYEFNQAPQLFDIYHGPIRTVFDNNLFKGYLLGGELQFPIEESGYYDQLLRADILGIGRDYLKGLAPIRMIDGSIVHLDSGKIRDIDLEVFFDMHNTKDEEPRIDRYYTDPGYINPNNTRVIQIAKRLLRPDDDFIVLAKVGFEE